MGAVRCTKIDRLKSLLDSKTNRQWFCPQCCAKEDRTEVVKSDVMTDEVDATLPAIGYRMQKGRFLDPDWESLLVSDEHKAMAGRALATGE